MLDADTGPQRLYLRDEILTAPDGTVCAYIDDGVVTVWEAEGATQQDERWLDRLLATYGLRLGPATIEMDGSRVWVTV
jgi:hypothetical protein